MEKQTKQHSQSQQKRKVNPQLTPELLEDGKIPPQAIDLEEAVLGACLLEKGAYDEIAFLLNPECFYKDSHQIIFRSIQKLASKGEPVDILTATNILKDTGELDKVGGAYYITKLTDRVASTANIQYHSLVIYEKYVQRENIRLLADVVKAAYEDFGELQNVYASSTQEIDNLFVGKQSVRNMAQMMDEHIKEVHRRIKDHEKGISPGIDTGVADLNKITIGWQGGDLIIVAGRPGMGKTAIALNKFGKHAATIGKHTLFFSLEMTGLRLTDRLVCSFGGIDPYKLRKGSLNQLELQKYNETERKLRNLTIHIDDNASTTVKRIQTIARSKNRRGQCDMIIIDYLQLIETSQDRYYQKNREREVAEMTRSLKLLAKELNIPIMLLGQLSRNVENRGGDKRPQLSDLRESGAIEQDADIVLFPYRPEYYGITHDAEGTSIENTMILICAKNRDGSIGDVYLKHSKDLTQFYDFEY